MFYFEYGSMMGQDEMQKYCPGARFVTVAFLPFHGLGFQRRSPDRGFGFANANANRGSNIWGVIYELTNIELERLDPLIDLRPSGNLKYNAYHLKDVKVYAENDPNTPIEALIYVGSPAGESSPPNQEYKKLLVNGAINRRLPKEYQAALKRIQAPTAMDMPLNCQLPLFVYGALKPGFPAYQLIEKFVDCNQPDNVEGELLIRDGLPLLSLKIKKHNDPVEGFLIKFKSGQEQEGYRAVCNFEPPNHYVWEQVNTKGTSRIANTLKIRMPSKGNPINGDHPCWQLSDDPVFGTV
jgi:gamma-glutamylcyclotransferase (GGCT)/AIG2-like uncharacterized protein YtfP